MVSETRGAVGYMDYTAVFKAVAFEGFLHWTVVFVGISSQSRNLLKAEFDAPVG